MAAPVVTMQHLLEAGAHFGHQTHRWNPRMKPYIFGARNGIHIIDLTQTTPLLHQALVKVSDTVASGGRVLCVTALGESAKLAQIRAYEMLAPIRFDGMQLRRDIGHRALKTG